MVNKEFILKNLQEIIEDNYYIVDIKVSPSSKIIVHIDSKEGITLDYCRLVHKKLYSIIEEKIETFQLDISSPGLSNYLKIWQQYDKIIGERLYIVTEEETFEGFLKSANETEIEVQKSKQELITLSYDQIKKAKQVINFNKNKRK